MNLNVASSPHAHAPARTSRIMLDVAIALLPALAVGAIVLGVRALLVCATSIASAVAFEWLFCVLTRKKPTIFDGSALVTGLLLALTLPVSVPLWLVVAGDFFAIIVIKAIFGGLGQNVFNPALAGRAFMLLVWPVGVTVYPSVDGVSSATPLHRMVMPALPEQSLLDMFLGNCPGSIGEISALALLLGGAYLVARRVISPRIPLVYIGTVAALTLIFHRTDDALAWMAYSVLSGGLMLGAIFMATDYTTSPVTPRGQLIYAVAIGILTVVFRYFGLFPEGVSYAILLANACVWALDRLTPRARFGVKKGGAR